MIQLSRIQMPKSFAFLLSLCAVAAATASNNENAVEHAQGIVAEFSGRLKPELKAALQEGGPSKAIEVCSTRAPAIAQTLSETSGWKVKRVSDRNRNPNATPDTWEQAALNSLASRAVDGSSTPLFIYEETPDGFRYAQAQITEGLCLTCHGKSIAPDTQVALDMHYPSDLATGYKLGEVRGIISLIRPAE
jgi:hypothetical protein